MRAIITADWHIRATKPRCRVEEDKMWMSTQFNALMQIGDIAIDKDCDVICVGDIFNSNSDTSFQCINIIEVLAERLNVAGRKLGVLAGNHDLPYHSSENIDKSAIGVLLNCNNIYKISSLMSGEYYDYYFSACNFDEETENKEIIFKHILTFPDEESKPELSVGVTAQDLLDKYDKAKWIFTGDYHGRFHYEKNGRHVINSGCLIRQTSAMKDYQCGVYYVDTDDDKVEFIPIRDDYDLVDDSYILKQHEREERIDDFVDRLKDAKSVTLDFKDNVEKAMIQNKITGSLKDTIDELMEV